MLVWSGFLVCLAVIGFAGTRLSRYGDVIADKTHLGGTWIGVILLATVTSLPELVTGVTAVTVTGVPDIAVGNVLGACVFNLLVLALLDVVYRPTSVYDRAARGHVLSGAFGVVLIGVAGAAVVLASHGVNPAIGHVSIFTPLIAAMYFVAMRSVFRYERREVAVFTVIEPDRYPAMTLRGAVIRYVVAALMVVAAGSFLPPIGERIAVMMAWHESFVGTLLVAFATTLPEIVVTLSALRIGAVDLAVGNLFGSNLFDIAILAIDDVLFFEGPLFAHVATGHAMSALSAVMMTGMAIVGLFYRASHRLLGTVGWTSVGLVSVYLANAWVLFHHGG